MAPSQVIPILGQMEDTSVQVSHLWSNRGFLPKNFRCEALNIGDYEYVNFSSFVVLGVKLWLEEDGDLNRNDPFKFIQSKAHN